MKFFPMVYMKAVVQKWLNSTLLLSKFTKELNRKVAVLSETIALLVLRKN
ncbi:MAG: hypothetical protein ACPG52_00500 [Cognaticolwellia sp.]